MDDFYTEPKTEEPKEEPIEKIKVGEKEYTQAELQDMIGVAESTREIEKNLNTKIDRVYPEFTKATQKNKEYEQKLKEIESRSQSPQDLDENQIREARAAAKKIGIVTKDEFAQYMNEHFRPAYMQERAAEKLLDDCHDLEKTFNGEDGKPKFKTEDVLKWMADNGGKNPEQAYKMMYEKQIDEWKSKTLGEAKPKGMVTETDTQAGGKEPPKVRVTRDNIDELMREALGQG